jgi:hypothetical protein|tara:strand:+ start:23 stop:544 length:522 start_codon:yes stop_codon:yes gene_type:complete
MANPLYGQNKFDDEVDSRMLRASDGSGIHEYYEEVTPTTADDNDVAASLSIKLPVGCIILDATITARALATSDHGLWALEVHNAVVADDAASGGTEIVGEDVAGDVSIPDNDLDTSNNAGGLLAINLGSLGAVDRTGAVTYLHVCAKEDCSSMTGTPKVGVYVKWFGPPSIAI